MPGAVEETCSVVSCERTVSTETESLEGLAECVGGSPDDDAVDIIVTSKRLRHRERKDRSALDCRGGPHRARLLHSGARREKMQFSVANGGADREIRDVNDCYVNSGNGGSEFK